MCNYFTIIILLLPFTLVSSVTIDNEKILSDSFINEINNIQKMWKAGRNFHKNSELKNLLNVNDFKRKYILNTKSIEIVNNITINFDSRLNWKKCSSLIGNIKTQGNCASSYAIVPAAVFTDRICIQKNITRHRSADQLLSCCRKCGGGCFGGYSERSFIYMKEVGLITGGGYKSNDGCRPYKIPKCQLQNNLQLCEKIRKLTPSCLYLKCSNSKYVANSYDKDKIKMKTIYSVPNDVKLIKSEIITNGPVSATIIIYEDFFNYKNGVYSHVTGSKIGKHVVKIIGWGKTKKKSVPYWLVINSWSKQWGDSGLFKIKQGECDIEKNVLAGLF